MIECNHILAVLDAERENQPALGRALEIAQKTGAKVVELPHDVGAVKGAQSIERFFDTLVRRVCN